MLRLRLRLVALLLPALTAVVVLLAPPPQSEAVVLAAPRAGTFCRSVDAGRIELAANGTQLRCERTEVDPRLRWRVVK